ncbi:MAG: hypothetical protein JWO82_2110 [Akkermansiaceae bacterium]|nr:hypothetical protein [Akkermansiaceae bacterium]
MSIAEEERELTRRLKVQQECTGIPVNDLRRMCLRAGLKDLEEGNLKIVPVKPLTPSAP